ncbi:MAG: glycosyltransferase family 39 protein [Bacteroidota bacterium]|nr:glycosyltransferase family 39 protein [Bacteroidota bacterium]
MKSNSLNIFLIVIIGGLLFIPFAGAVHLFDWDEINFAEAAREMIITGNYESVTINYQVFTEKPPLFFWVQVLSMKIFGINEFASRFPNAVIGIISLLSLYFIGKQLKNEKFGLFWVLAYSCSFLPHLYFRSGIIDPLFNLFMFLSVFFAFKSLFNLSQNSDNNSSIKINLVLSGLFIGLAILTKGPVGLLLPSLSIFIFCLINNNKVPLKLWMILLFATSILLIPTIWYGIETMKNGNEFIREFIIRNIELFKNQDAGHGGHFYYHWLVVLFGVFPASIFAIGSFKKYSSENSETKLFKQLMIILLLVVLIIFSIVNTKIIHYSSLSYYPLTFLAALFIYKISLKQNTKASILQKTLIITITSFISILLISFPIIARNSQLIFPYLDDPFMKEALDANVNWKFSTFLPGIVFILLGIISIIWFLKEKTKFKSIMLLMATSLITLQLSIYIFVSKIEKLSQNAMVEFCQSIQQKDCYVETLGFKSYAHYFYSNVKPQENPNYNNLDWLLNGDIDKTAFFITKIQKAEEFKKIKDMKELYSKNGFVFLKREKTKER